MIQKHIKTNFHMHSSYSDGKNTLEEMILSAIDMGGEAVGFSDHGYMPIDDIDWDMTVDSTEEYIKEVSLLKEKYAGKIKVYCGIEADYHTVYDKSKFDFSIGSVHLVPKDGELVPVDNSASEQEYYVKKLYGGDYLAFAKDYFSLVGDIIKKTDADIIGHFDLLYKFNEINHRYDENDRKLVRAATDAIDKLIPYNRLFEVNTGAISRGYRTTPYPSLKILDYIAERGGRIIFNSDSHIKDTVYFKLDEVYEMLLSHSFPKEKIEFYPFKIKRMCKL